MVCGSISRVFVFLIRFVGRQIARQAGRQAGSQAGYKGQPNTAIGLVFNSALTYKNSQQHINNTIEIVKTF